MIRIILIEASLSELHSNMQNGMLVYVQRITAKNRIATYYCSFELMDTSLQVLYNAKIFGFMYRHSILGWYSEPCHNEKAAKITDTMYVWHMQWTPLIIQMKTNYTFDYKDTRIHDKEGIHMVTIYHV